MTSCQELRYRFKSEYFLQRVSQEKKQVASFLLVFLDCIQFHLNSTNIQLYLNANENMPHAEH